MDLGNKNEFNKNFGARKNFRKKERNQIDGEICVVRCL